MVEIFKEGSKFRAFLLSIAMMSIGYGLYKGVIDNYLAEVVGMGEFDRGVSEFFRELPGLAELCRAIGIRVLFVQNFKTAPIYGMYRWYKDVPMIMLHNRFEKRETMWFTFFHELAHVLYHGKKGICLRNLDIVHNFPEKEDEADCFA